MADALLLILFVVAVAAAAEFVRARCRRELLASIVVDRSRTATETAVAEPVSG